MPLRDHDARFAVAIDLLFVDTARQHVALIRRQDEDQLAMLGEKLCWGESAAQGLLRALREELALHDPAAAGLRSCRLAGLFGLEQPQRDHRFLGAASLAERAQVLSLLYLLEADLPRLLHTARPGPDSSVLALERVAVTELSRHSLFLDHATLIRQVLAAERAGRLPLFPLGTGWPFLGRPDGGASPGQQEERP